MYKTDISKNPIIGCNQKHNLSLTEHCHCRCQILQFGHFTYKKILLILKKSELYFILIAATQSPNRRPGKVNVCKLKLSESP